MNCNDAFDRLTMPSGRNDARLTAHLATCPRCRAMAETLAPALDLFAQTDFHVTAAEDHPTTAMQIATKSATRLHRRARRTDARTSTRPASKLAWMASAIAGAACCFLVLEFREQSDQASPQTASCPRQSPAAVEWLGRNSVPMAMACVACHPSGQSISPRVNLPNH